MRLFIVLVLGTILRVVGLKNLSFWHDEALFAALSQNFGFSDMLTQISTKVHPPLYFLLLKMWGNVFGNGEVALRSLSVVFGILTIWVGYFLARELFVNRPEEKENISLLVALLLAINPYTIQSSMQATSFALAGFLLLTSSFLLLKALRENKRLHWVLYALALTAAIYTHYLVLFAALAQLLFMVYYLLTFKPESQNHLHVYFYPLGSWLLAALIFLPWVPTFWQQITTAQNNFWTPSVSIPLTLLIPAGLGVLILLFWFGRTFKEQTKWLIILMAVVPYIIFSVPLLTIVITTIIFTIPWIGLRKIIVTALVLSVFAFSLVQSINNNPTKNPGMRGATEFINERISENDQVLLGSQFVDYSFKYYNQGILEPLLVTNRTVIDQLETRPNDTIWLVWTTGFDKGKPNTPGNWKDVEETKFSDAPDFKGDVIVTQYLVGEILTKE